MRSLVVDAGQVTATIRTRSRVPKPQPCKKSNAECKLPERLTCHEQADAVFVNPHSKLVHRDAGHVRVTPSWQSHDQPRPAAWTVSMQPEAACEHIKYLSQP